ncbi:MULTISPECIES: hypothetical protein [Chromobacterium]|uniref:Uncharacterized protein n=1 Tax=Chromobacterium phragmitis TaxID=2202141 RepID=A0ABV0J0N6_9NEIS|nr:hypothetical protein [Chromobacterium sp. ASV23]
MRYSYSMGLFQHLHYRVLFLTKVLDGTAGLCTTDDFGNLVLVNVRASAISLGD